MMETSVYITGVTSGRPVSNAVAVEAEGLQLAFQDFATPIIDA